MSDVTEPEEWRPIPRSGNRYEASSYGRVRRTDSGRLLKLSLRRDGYYQVDLSLDGARVTSRVNVLICEAFHGPCNPGMVAAHINGNPPDNRPENLMWATASENALHRLGHGTMIVGTQVPHAVLTENDVRRIREDRAQGKTLASIAADYGVSHQTIHKIVHRVRWAHVE